MTFNKNSLCELPELTKIIGLGFLLSASFTLNACDKDNDSPAMTSPSIAVTDIIVPINIELNKGAHITLSGCGVLIDDIIVLVSTDGNSDTYRLNVSGVTESTFSFTPTADIKSGKYKITLQRGEKTLSLGSATINFKTNLEIPDIDGMNIKGVVYCDGEGIAGVAVSDGVEVTTTDENGAYYLASSKQNGYVFISLPSNFEVANDGNRPLFYQNVSNKGVTEQCNFSLFSTNNENHVVITMADMHLANRNNDIEQFTRDFLSDVNNTITSHIVTGKKVYGLTLGDMSWDQYWYSNNFGLKEYVTQAGKIACPVFNVQGNHDNDPYVADDFLSEQPYRDIVGPTYYSFNLGNSHYIVLDNIQYLNNGASNGVVGSRNYNAVISQQQIEWLRKDLELVTDKSAPLYIAMHIPLYSNPTLNSQGAQSSAYATINGAGLVESIAGFSDVRILTGHTHINYAVQPNETIREYNTAAVCATWWWTGKNGYAENHISKDGTPGGYGVWENSASLSEYYYKSLGYERSYQMRTYDMNNVLISAEKFSPNSTNDALAEYAGVYANPSTPDEVLINVWGYGPGWSIEVMENNASLQATRVYAKDPLHIISYEALRLNVGSAPTSSFVSCNTAHLFKVKASAPDTTIEVRVTDNFGNVFTETMQRPKVFSHDMR